MINKLLKSVNNSVVYDILIFLFIFTNSLLIYRIPLGLINITLSRVLMFFIMIFLAFNRKYLIESKRNYIILFILSWHIIIPLFDTLRTYYYSYLQRVFFIYIEWIITFIMVVNYCQQNLKNTRKAIIFTILSSILPMIIGIYTQVQFLYRGVLPEMPFSTLVNMDVKYYRLGLFYAKGIYRIAGTFSDPTVYGLFLIINLLFSFHVLENELITPNLKRIIVTLIIINSYLLTQTYSISSYIVIVISLAFIFINKLVSAFKRNKSNLIAFGIISIILLAIISSTSLQIDNNDFISKINYRLNTKLQYFDSENIYGDRAKFFSNAMDIFFKNPFFGCGEGNMWVYDYYGAAPVAHNLYLTYLADGGIIFAVLKLSLFIYLILLIMKSKRNKMHIFLVLLSVMMINLFYYLFHYPFISIALAIFYSYVMNYNRENYENS